MRQEPDGRVFGQARVHTPEGCWGRMCWPRRSVLAKEGAVSFGDGVGLEGSVGPEGQEGSLGGRGVGLSGVE